jgi:hypothetical protein
VIIAPNSNSCEKAFGFLSLQPSIQMNLKAERDKAEKALKLNSLFG